MKSRLRLSELEGIFCRAVALLREVSSGQPWKRAKAALRVRASQQEGAILQKAGRDCVREHPELLGVLVLRNGHIWLVLVYIDCEVNSCINRRPNKLSQ